ncbi:MAG TPA: peroxidase family protein [Mycobacteriales bacterium]|nr:peroxidase family protein [Mycobacteriales bacterium]
MSPRRYRSSLAWRIYDGIATALDHRFGWDRLPRPVGLLTLVGLRNVLRRENLYDTGALPAVNRPKPAPATAQARAGRTADGSYDDLDDPAMGMAGTRFGRNVPLEATTAETASTVFEPNPRLVSRELLTRHEFVPAPTLNVLAAAWIQFMVKDWFSHGEGDPDRSYDLPLDADDQWPQPPLHVLATLPDPTRPVGTTMPPTFVNKETHWWDSSQIYGGGSMPQDRTHRRSGVGGKLLIGSDGRLALPPDPAVSPASVPGWWLGLELMATLFVKEHNAVCDALAAAYPGWDDDRLYRTARLVTSALIAKIHTVEWTPAIIAHPTTVTALRANWWGLAGERIRRRFGRISRSEVISGIPGSRPNHYGVPYSLTEEFTIVYRMHPLIPDDYELLSLRDGAVMATATFRDLAGQGARSTTADYDLADLYYSLGCAHPGALVLNNYPRFLQEFQRPDSDVLMDLAATDVLRSRELGVPRYNEFRRLLHLRACASFDELTDDEDLRRRLRAVYDDIEQVDTMVGMFAEKRPKGFGFSGTAFRVFILMASRRLNSDRFFTSDFTPEVYSQVGFDWVQSTSMSDVLRRHHPELAATLDGLDNAFQPWVSSTSDGRSGTVVRLPEQQTAAGAADQAAQPKKTSTSS